MYRAKPILRMGYFWTESQFIMMIGTVACALNRKLPFKSTYNFLEEELEEKGEDQ